MERREFIKMSMSAVGAVCLADWQLAFAAGQTDKLVGKVLPQWRNGQFQVHFIYTGVAESMFIIFPDSTTMLLDCGDINAAARGSKQVPILPNSQKHSSEWITRYVQRVNPHGNDVDYFLLSHYHSDHAGSERYYTAKQEWKGEPYCLSGIVQAAQTLRFGKAIDRCWPTFNEPLPPADADVVRLMQKFYQREQEEHGMKVERFELGSTSQISLLRHPKMYPSFQVRNICANGKIADQQGNVIDLYADHIKVNKLTRLNENGMSLGMIFSYGPFRFFTAGDFSDRWKLSDGSYYNIEDSIAEVCGKAQVAKLNHHGYYHSMTEKLVSALQSRVYVSCVWDQLHCTDPVMTNLSNRNLYPGDRILCPTILPVERRVKEAARDWMDDVPTDSYQGSHVVLTVEEKGEDYSITYVDATNEGMKVKSVMRFKS